MKYIFILFPLFSLLSIELCAQGCSDAGFCTMGAMRPNQAYSKRLNLKLRSVEYNFYRGKSNLTPVIYAHTVEFNASLGNKISLQLKAPFMHIAGNLGQNSGLGDISLSASRTVGKWKNGNIGITFGAKIPTNHSNAEFTSAESANLPADLPMYYQTSLGSFDLVTGAAWINEKWLFATGIQIALTQNKNEFRWGEWPAYPDPFYVRKYDLANHLKRGTDVMLRAERSFRFLNFDFSLGILPIYRITQDEIFNTLTERREKVDKTTGLALSGLTSFGYQLSVNHGLRLVYGYKLTDREINPDGLTRKNVLSFTYAYKF